MDKLNKNTAAALAVLLSPTIVAPLVLMVLKRDPFVRFYAAQSLILFLVLIALYIGLAVTIILGFLIPVVGISWFIVWLISVYKAWNGEEFKIPFFAKLASQLLGKV